MNRRKLSMHVSVSRSRDLTSSGCVTAKPKIFKAIISADIAIKIPLLFLGLSLETSCIVLCYRLLC